MKIREAREEDLDALVELWYESSLKAHDFIPATYWEENKSAMRGLYLPLSLNMIIDDNAGFISMMGNEINALFIAPDRTQKGLGSALLNWAKQKEDKLMLNVYACNENAVKFYEKHGFVMTERSIDEAVSEEQIRMQWTKNE